MAHSSSHTVDLARIQQFISAAPQNSTVQLRRRMFIGGVALVLLGSAGVALYKSQAKPAPAAMEQAVPVAVETLRPQHVSPWSEFSGRINAVDYAEIRPEVGGRITEIRFQDGQQVKKGDVLFVIDPRPYQAAVAKARGDLASAQNNARLAKIELDRGSRLVKAQALAQEQFDQRANADGVAQAAVQSARAALDQAALDVDHAYVKAPISGRVSRAEITLGNLVQTAPSAPLLTSIVSDNGVYADFEVDEQTYLNTVHGQAKDAAQEKKIPVELTVGTDTAHVYRGMVESFDNHIATGSGTIRARARFPNQDGSLVPGMFVTVRLGGGAMDNALLVPESAVGNDQSKRFVYVVGEGDKATYREVTLGQTVNGERVVASGLKAGDRVILDGLQKIGPGAAVAPKTAGTVAAN
jgi:membrane fusion protein, multidrug efflux system